MESDSVEKQVTALVNNLIPDTLPCGVQCKPYLNPSGACNGSHFRKCPHVRKILDVDDHSGCQSPPPPPLPPSLPPPAPRRRPLTPPTVPSETASPMAANGHHVSQKHVFIISVTVMGCMIGAVLLFCILRKIFRDYRSRRRNLRRTRTAQMSFGGPQEDFFGEDQGPVVDHPIWYINTIGLEQSVIDSIAIFKYKKGEGLIEGTECSVCLNEFQEDESLRLLPKCSHAFHISCIDTWLRSHKNCPLCRAPVVCNNYGAQVGPSVVAATSDLSPTEEPQIENSVNSSGGFVSNEGGEDGTSEVRNEDSNVCQLPIESDEPIARNSKVNTIDPSILRNHSRVKSDMVGNSLAVEAEKQSMRRSLSLDFSSASAIYDAVASFSSVKHQGDLNTQLAGLNHSKLKKVTRRGSSGNSSFRKLIRSSSIGLSLQMGSLSMKRSFSYSRKSSASRHNRSQDSILPL